jgi:fucose 4-O-acetylase-like acetyltransferase
MSKRIHWIDICKAIAIFAIVLGHVLRGGAVQQYVLSFHVPLFFMLSGVVFSSGGRGFRSFAARKARAVLLPYFIWGFISCVIYALLGSFAAKSLGVNVTQSDSFFMTLLSFVYGNESVFTMVANLPLWFLPCLFAVYMIMYPAAELNGRRLYAVTLLCFAAGGINANLTHIYRLPFNIENAVFMSGFFALGMCIRRSPLFSDSDRFSAAHTAAGIALIGAGAVFSQLNGHIAYSWSVYGTYHLYMAGALCGCLGWVLISRQLPKLRAVEAVGASTLAILVMHKFPILVFQTAVPVVKTLLAANNPLCGIAVSAAVVAMCMAVKLIFGKKLWFML